MDYALLQTWHNPFSQAVLFCVDRDSVYLYFIVYGDNQTFSSVNHLNINKVGAFRIYLDNNFRRFDTEFSRLSNVGGEKRASCADGFVVILFKCFQFFFRDTAGCKEFSDFLPAKL